MAVVYWCSNECDNSESISYLEAGTSHCVLHGATICYPSKELHDKITGENGVLSDTVSPYCELFMKISLSGKEEVKTSTPVSYVLPRRSYYIQIICLNHPVSSESADMNQW